MKSFLLVALLVVAAFVGGAPAPARAVGPPPVTFGRAGIGTSHFGGGGRVLSRPHYGYRRRGFGHGFFFFGGGGLGIFPVLLFVVLLFLIFRSGRRRR